MALMDLKWKPFPILQALFKEASICYCDFFPDIVSP